MSASVTVLDNPYFSFNGNDWTAQVKSVDLGISLEEIDSTASGDVSRVTVPGLEDWDGSVTVHWSSTIEGHLWTAKGTTVTIIVKRDDSAVGATNPTYTFTGYAQNWKPVSGAIGDGMEMEIPLGFSGTVVRATV